jgi:hypothetical protein
MSANTLKCKKVSHIAVEYRDLDKFIEEEYGLKDFSCFISEEMNEYAKYTFIVSEGVLLPYDESRLDRFKSGQPEKYILQIVLQDLCNQNKIEPGTYLVSAS